MVGQVAVLLVFLALAAQAILQAPLHPKAQTVAEVQTQARTPEQVAVEAVRQALRVVLDQGQTPEQVAQERHQALADRLSPMLVVEAAVLLKTEQAQRVVRVAVVLVETVVTLVMTERQTPEVVEVAVGHPTPRLRPTQLVAQVVQVLSLSRFLTPIPQHSPVV